MTRAHQNCESYKTMNTKNYLGMLLRCKEKANKGWENETSKSDGNYFAVLRFGRACVLNIMVIGHYTINIFQVLMIFWVWQQNYWKLSLWGTDDDF